MNKKLIWIAFVATVPLGVLGCSGGGAVSVSGTVTFKGEKVKGGTVTFAPIGKEGKSMAGAVKEDGSYTIDGVTPGKNRVTFSAPTGTDPVALKPGEKVKESPYAGLTVKTNEVEVKAGDKVDIELVGKPR